ncbi:ECF-type sigma factor [Planctomycetes bacterium K23_9]|uniref:RNA polymerase sigma factor n=1 Tax=Stieleria marina TaxID=1930275 RepID=A0A517NP72_9BACT|nr:RNA polymerase sigma factor [Planctomycetes bacterium K23_9]
MNPVFTDTTVTDASANDQNPGSLASSDWHARLRSGDPELTSQLWDKYFRRMVLLARKRMGGTPAAARDEEDIALSAFKSFCLGVRAGRISLDPEDVNLWPLLVTITLNKAIDQIRHENRLKRNTRDNPAGNEPKPDIEELCSREPTPAIAAAASETLENMLDCLRQTRDGALQTIAIASIEGSSAGEIAVSLDCSQRTVQRKLKTIKALWEARFDRD